MSNNSLSIDGTDLGGSSYGVRLERHSQALMSALSLDVQEIPGKHGAVGQGVYHQSRSVDLPIVIIGSSHTDRRSKIDELAYILGKITAAVVIKLDEIPGRYWNGRPNGDPEIEFIGSSNARGNLPLTFLDPIAFANSELTKTVSVTSSPQAFTVSGSSELENGTAYAQPVWNFKNTSGGAMTSITIANATTGETVASTLSVANNTWIQFDVYNKIVQTSPDDVTYTTNMAGKTGFWPRLKPRVDNSITITALNGTLKIIYRERYL